MCNIKKITGLAFCILFLFQINVDAGNTVSQETAETVALNYFSNLVTKYDITRENDIEIDNTVSQSYNGNVCCYFVNFYDGGYVLVAANDASIPILSYSFENTYDINDERPPAFDDLIETYCEQIDYIIENNVSNDDVIDTWYDILNNNLSTTRGTVVGPLLTSEWGQSKSNNGVCDAYNYYVTSTDGDCSCNSQKCPAGCVAVAMAQIMYFWKYPSTEFDWCNMADELITYSSNYTLERNSVANLIKTCGSDVNMDYCSGGDCKSSASNNDVDEALEYTYYYHSDIDYQRRVFWGKNEWIGRMKYNLNNEWPFIYGGQKNNSGHSFVCDGYNDDDNQFHFNFGWRGSYDGWFTIDDLTPSSSNYNNWQDAVFYIRPSTTEDYCGVTVNLGSYYLYIYYIWDPNAGTAPDPYEITPTGYANIISANESYPSNYRTIETGVTAEYEAHKSITLQSGFKVEANADFTARIRECPGCRTSSSQKRGIVNDDPSLFNNSGVDESQVIYIYPNPSNGEFSISTLTNDDQLSNIYVYNLLGNLISKKQNIDNYTTQIDLSNYPDGIYFIHAETANGNVGIQKVIKK